MARPKHDSWCRCLAGKMIDKYTLLDFVSAGRIGYVYRGQHEDFSGSRRAVKLIFDELKGGWDVELRKVMQLELIDGVVHFHQLGSASITHDG